MQTPVRNFTNLPRPSGDTEAKRKPLHSRTQDSQLPDSPNGDAIQSITSPWSDPIAVSKLGSTAGACVLHTSHTAWISAGRGWVAVGKEPEGPAHVYPARYRTRPRRRCSVLSIALPSKLLGKVPTTTRAPAYYPPVAHKESGVMGVSGGQCLTLLGPC